MITRSASILQPMAYDSSPAAWSVVLLVIFASGCGGGSATTAPLSGPSTIPLPGNAVLTGRVTDRITSAPLPGASVVFSQAHPSPYVTTDGSGNYNLTG